MNGTAMEKCFLTNFSFPNCAATADLLQRCHGTLRFWCSSPLSNLRFFQTGPKDSWSRSIWCFVPVLITPIVCFEEEETPEGSFHLSVQSTPNLSHESHKGGTLQHKSVRMIPKTGWLLRLLCLFPCCKSLLRAPQRWQSSCSTCWSEGSLFSPREAEALCQSRHYDFREPPSSVETI